MAAYYLTRVSEDRVRISFNPLDTPIPITEPTANGIPFFGQFLRLMRPIEYSPDQYVYNLYGFTTLNRDFFTADLDGITNPPLSNATRLVTVDDGFIPLENGDELVFDQPIPAYVPGSPEPSVPDPPIIASITPNAGTCTIVWQKPAYQGTTSVYAIQLGYASLGTIWYTDASSTPTGSFSLPVPSGSSIPYRLYARNQQGNSYSTLFYATRVPNPPTITSISPSLSSLEVFFAAPTELGSSPITGYEYSLNNGVDYFPAGSTSPFTISSLSSGEYSVTLRAVTDIGSSPWSDPFSAIVSSFYTVYAVSDRVVRVALDPLAFPIPPVRVSSTGYQDALNPRTWLISQASKDPAVGPDDYYPLTTLSVLSTDAYTYDIFTLENFARANGPLLHMLTPVGLKLENGSVVYPGLWTETQSYFNGSIQSSDASANRKTAQRGFSTRDLANVATPYDDLVGGTLVINDAGDYASVSGEQFIRKLVLRRLISKKGDFFHLPNYGAGLGVKSTFSTANLRMMAKDIEMQVLLEPEVEQAKATLTYQASDGTLTIQVRARMRSTGQVSSISLNLPAGSIQF